MKGNSSLRKMLDMLSSPDPLAVLFLPITSLTFCSLIVANMKILLSEFMKYSPERSGFESLVFISF